MQIWQNSRILHITKQESYKLLHTYFSAHNYMYDIYLNICRLVLNVYNFTMLTVFCIKIYVFYTKSYNQFRTIVLNSLTPITYKNKISNIVGTHGSIQFICRPIVLHSNILSLTKSLIGIGTVRLAPILLSLISETSCFLGLLLACHIRNPVGSLSVQQVLLTLILTALIDLHLLD